MPAQTWKERLRQKVLERLRCTGPTVPYSCEGPDMSKVLSGLPKFAGNGQDDVELFLGLVKQQLDVRGVPKERWSDALISALRGEAFKMVQLFRDEAAPEELEYKDLAGKLIMAFKPVKDPHYHLSKLLKMKITKDTNLESFVAGLKNTVAEAYPEMNLKQREKQVKGSLIHALPRQLKITASPYIKEDVPLSEALEMINNMVDAWQEKSEVEEE